MDEIMWTNEEFKEYYGTRITEDLYSTTKWYVVRFKGNKRQRKKAMKRWDKMTCEHIKKD